MLNVVQLQKLLLRHRLGVIVVFGLRMVSGPLFFVPDSDLYLKKLIINESRRRS